VAVIGVIALLDVLIGAAAGAGRPALGLLIAAVPIAAIVAARIAVAQPDTLIFIAFALAFIPASLDDPLPGTAGTAIFPADILVMLAAAGWIVTRLHLQPEGEPRRRRSIVVSWPLVLLAATVTLGVIRGHDRYGTSYVSQPTRLVAYAAIAAAILGSTPHRLYRGIVAVFYTGAVVQTIVGIYHLATGTSATKSAVLSTGGTRALALSTAMYLSGALILALLNLELDRAGRRVALHLAIAGLATFGMAISLGRTTFAAGAVLVPLLILGLRHARRTLLSYLPLFVPVLAVLVLIIAQTHPSLGSTLGDRLTGRLGTDVAVIDRQRKTDAQLEGLGEEPVFGFGFGRPVHWIAADNVARSGSGDLENSYVWLLTGGGVAALATFIGLMLSFYADAIRRLRRATGEARALVIFAMSLAFVFFVNALTGPVLSTPGLLLTIWITLLLPALVEPPGGRPSSVLQPASSNADHGRHTSFLE
jgi:hypothetical protein